MLVARRLEYNNNELTLFCYAYLRVLHPPSSRLPAL
jgi:hypothetical protein